ncbi:phospholipase A2 family protein [Mesobacillus harenae]|uniref:phospholipase A2 family protein n=1 Tax=Mesobacillus harenae TaxID=2213203 RepID=UPI001F550398|nr:phospholipase A2 family protein [Mesobacillus harenae]
MRRRRKGFCIPGYRWCGPGCGGPGAPTNSVDGCCKIHDECYRRFGPAGGCDQVFLNCLRTKVHPHSKERADAALFYNFIRIRHAFRSW